jgi:hypothetical protein
MRGAVILEGQSIELSGKTFIISNFCFIPDSEEIYVKIYEKSKPGVTINYAFEKLLPFIKQQIKL